MEGHHHQEQQHSMAYAADMGVGEDNHGGGQGDHVVLAPATHHYQHHQHHQHQHHQGGMHHPHHGSTGPMAPHMGGQPAGPLPIPCKFFAMGICKYGENCRFAHFRAWNGRGGRGGNRGGHRGGRGAGPGMAPGSPMDVSGAVAGGLAPAPHQHQHQQHQRYMGAGQHPFQHHQHQHPQHQQQQHHQHPQQHQHHNGRGGFVPRGGRGFGGPGGGYMGGGRGRGGYHTGDQRPYGKPPGLDYEKKEERKEQIVDYFLVLDLEGKQEILEFPVALVNAKTLEAEDLFHRYVRPVTFSEEHLAQYITGKYGKFGLTDKWFESAMPFTDVLVQFNDWLGNHGLLHSILRSEDGEETGEERQAAFTFLFVTCGNWDIKTQIPRQCAISKFDMPGYFHEWVNLKDVYLNFYKHKALGMRSMLSGLGLEGEGDHHSGKDDVHNICKIVSRMVEDGVLVEPTAKRAIETGYVTYKYQHRV